jgi:hypothetical protein
MPPASAWVDGIDWVAADVCVGIEGEGVVYVSCNRDRFVSIA